MTERASPLPRSAALSQKAALPMITPSVIACGDATFPKSSYPNPTCENGVQKRPQAFLNPEIKISFPLMMRRATRSAFQIVFTQGGISPHEKQPLHGKAQRLLCL